MEEKPLVINLSMSKWEKSSVSNHEIFFICMGVCSLSFYLRTITEPRFKHLIAAIISLHTKIHHVKKKKKCGNTYFSLY